ncbi:MAG: FmdE, Molybdenum formylmethanofuran dehydrogenase operon [Firmicutes bacterium]|nr:FmdE, Molybdenum formylmethanofuran dehydrogenase operon [Bacillota bacterium]
MESRYSADWQKVVEFHGHVCPGLASGYRLAKAALAALGYSDPGEGDLVTIAESDRCTIDAFQIVLGCTIGKGKLYLKTTGKQAFIVGCRKSGQAVRVVALPYKYSPESDALNKKVMSGGATEDEYRHYKSEQENRIQEIMTLPDVALLKVEVRAEVLPERELIYSSPCCEYCGEQVMEPWARIRAGKVACIQCAIDIRR